MYDHILVPTDGSTGTAHVALHAIELAEIHGATLHTLHVIDAALTGHLTDAGMSTDSLDDRAHQAVETIERMANRHDVDCHTAVRRGSPAETILDYANGEAIDVIVAGTHGRSGVKRHLVGSVTERLVRHASCPVLSVRLPDTDVTVEDEGHARRLVEEALDDEGYDAADIDIERQLSVWVAHADTDSGEAVVYLDPTTQRTSVLGQ
ncbi:Nucleotide-binding universal stress protein, UspA family [Halovenus aranensis]|uniref:Nucleotide-binding universal stress protein, UspA family n=1 Tax=Halovenus aranensis TaxID=890420 RepID=A0A1G8T096_9EURY|nr:universal stress protein [Halovenus aranensis]SDJ34210.1 Nucleotide-binding universal stress protein, UspA family [Halovenus aranensis]